jgi:phage terminase Nu1 subunit (DNA packaging protein)
MDNELPAAEFQKLVGVNKVTVADLAKRGVVVRGKKRGTYTIESVSGYCAHLREQAAGRGGDAGADVRARFGSAQASLAEARAQRMRGEVAPIAEVERTLTDACRAIRARVLAVGDRMRDLTARQHGKLTQELRAALSDLADGPKKKRPGGDRRQSRYTRDLKANDLPISQYACLPSGDAV